jgi:sortase A
MAMKPFLKSVRHVIRRRVDALFFAAGLALVGIWATASLESHAYQKTQARRLDAIVPAVAAADRGATTAAASTPFIATAARSEAGRTGLVGRIEIPRLKLSAVVAEGMDEPTLKRAVGHVPRTAFPGEYGNVGLAAHRDSFFRKLRGIRKSDVIRITTPDGTFQYAVDTITIVTPEQVEYLYPTVSPVVTLVTCYPFDYVGNAPKRFIVRARQVDGVREELRADERTAVPTLRADGR